MQGMDPRALAFIGIFCVVGVIILFSVMTHDFRRRKGLAALAPELGFTYQRKANSLLEQFEGFRLFPPGSNPWITNVLQGEVWGATVWLLDYSYHTGGKSSSYHNYTVCVLRTSELKLPYFFLQGEIRALHNIGQFLVNKGIVTETMAQDLGAGDIDFPEDEEFSRKFVLQGEKEAVRVLFDAEVRQHFMRFAGTLFRMEGRGDTLLYTSGSAIQPKAVREVIQQATDVLALLAPHNIRR